MRPAFAPFVTFVLAFACGCYHASFAQDVPCSADLACPGDGVCDTTRSPPLCVRSPGGSGAEGDANIPLDGAITACGACANPAPVCDATTTTCRGCVDDAECGSSVCVERTGTCVPEPLALYVKNGGSDASTCTRAEPCASITRALSLVDTSRYTIKLYDGTYRDALATSASFVLSGESDGSPARVVYKALGAHDHVLELDGGTALVEGVILDGGNGATVRAQNGAALTAYRVEMLNSPIGTVEILAATADLEQVLIHDNQGAEGAVEMLGGQLTLERSAVYSVAGPCVRASGKYTIENSFLVACGLTGFVQGGPAVTGSIFRFNTVVGDGSGATCGQPAALEDSIFANNGSTPQISATCAATYSLFTDTAPSGPGNISNGNPGFVSTDNHHITSFSGARDKADPAATLTFDFDGELRPHGPARDIGADEHY